MKKKLTVLFILITLINVQSIKSQIIQNPKTEIIAFKNVDTPPFFYNSKYKKISKKNFIKELNEYVLKNIDLSNIKRKKNRKVKLVAYFIINDQGHITNIKARSKNELIEKELLRVLNSIPKIKPGKLDDKKVNTIFILFINKKL